jgi:hypothetical protein
MLFLTVSLLCFLFLTVVENSFIETIVIPVPAIGKKIGSSAKARVFAPNASGTGSKKSSASAPTASGTGSKKSSASASAPASVTPSGSSEVHLLSLGSVPLKETKPEDRLGQIHEIVSRSGLSAEAGKFFENAIQTHLIDKSLSNAGAEVNLSQVRAVDIVEKVSTKTYVNAVKDAAALTESYTQEKVTLPPRAPVAAPGPPVALAPNAAWLASPTDEWMNGANEGPSSASIGKSLASEIRGQRSSGTVGSELGGSRESRAGNGGGGGDGRGSGSTSSKADS